MEKKGTNNVVYVNPNFGRITQNDKTATNILTGCMHINPKFKGNINELVIQTCLNNQKHSNIHINPKLLQIANTIVPSNNSTLPPLHNPMEPQVNESIPTYLVNNRNKFVKATTVKSNITPNLISMPSVKPSLPVVINQVKKKPSYSIVRKDTRKSLNKIQPSNNILVRKDSRKCINKVQASNNTVSSKLIINASQSTSKCNVWKKKENAPTISYSAYSLKKRKSLCETSSKYRIKKVTNLHKYKINNEKLTASHKNSIKTTSTPLIKHVSKSVFIGGEKYLINNNVLQKIVKSKTTKEQNMTNSKSKQVKKINIGGVTYVRKSKNVFVMDNRMKNSMKKRKKINITCPIFRRFGLCKKHTEGKCPLVHDPRNISICQKFLKGICNVDGCHLSHNVVKEKMPTCKFFLEGCCVKENCPYLHVKLNENAKICQQFLNGYCDLGVNCNYKHLRVCPSFYKNSKCDKIKCPYPHKIVPKAKQPQLSDNYLQTSYSKPENNVNVCEKDSKESDNMKTLRYFEENEKNTQNTDEKEEVLYKGRPKLGVLPSFISLS